MIPEYTPSMLPRKHTPTSQPSATNMLNTKKNSTTTESNLQQHCRRLSNRKTATGEPNLQQLHSRKPNSSKTKKPASNKHQ